MQQGDNPCSEVWLCLSQTAHYFTAFRQGEWEPQRKQIFTNQKRCWGKPGISSGEGGGRACILCNTKHAAGTTRCPGRGVKTFYYSPSLKRAPHHYICCSKPRMYLSCILLSNLTVSFFWWFLSFGTDTQCSITETTLDTIPPFLNLPSTWWF